MAAGLSVLLLVTAAVASAAQSVRTVTRERAAAQRLSYEQWLEQGRRNAHSATHYGIYAYQPKSPLAVIDPGLDRYTGTVIFLESHKRNEPMLKAARDRTDVSRLIELSPAFTLHTLVPLWLMLLAFTSVSSERSDGTWRLLRSVAVPASAIGAGKLLGLAIAAGMLLVPAVALGASGLLLTSSETSTEDVRLRAALLAATYAAYFSAMLGVALAVSARSATARGALALLMGFWIAACWLAPRAVSEWASLRHPLPSTLELTHTVNDRLRKAEHGRHERLRAAVLEEHGVERVEELPFNFEGLDLQDSEELGNRVLDAVYADLARITGAQHAVERRGGLLSPVVPVRAVSMALAGTDADHHARFTEAAEQYRREMVRRMNRAVELNLGEVNEAYLGTPALNRTVGRDVWSRVPPFEYRSPGVTWVLRQQAGNIAIVLLWTVGSLGAAFWSLTRASVEP